jgi:hypothetical protein
MGGSWWLNHCWKVSAGENMIKTKNAKNNKTKNNKTKNNKTRM